MAVARSSSSRVMKSQGEAAILGVFLPMNALYSIAFGSHTKTAEAIEMPFGVTRRIGRRYHVGHGGPDLPRGRINFWGGRNAVAVHYKVMGYFTVSCARRPWL